MQLLASHHRTTDDRRKPEPAEAAQDHPDPPGHISCVANACLRGAADEVLDSDLLARLELLHPAGVESPGPAAPSVKAISLR